MAKIGAIQEVTIEDLIPYKNNSKTHDKTQVEKLKQSISEFGFVSPILIDADMNIIAGHGRIIAAKELGMERVPAVFIEGLTEAQRKAYIITDNRLTELGGWDMQIVKNELLALENEGFDTRVTGFDVGEIVVSDDMAAEYQETEALPETVSNRTRHGDIWILGDHRLMCGDSTKNEDVTALMDGRFADLLLTDPPYNVDYTGNGNMKIENDAMESGAFFNFLCAAFGNAALFMKEGAAYYCWHASKSMPEFYNALGHVGLPPRQCLIWVKSTLVLGRQDYQWRHEPCFYGWKDGGAHYFIDARSLTTVWDKTDDLSREEAIRALKEMGSVTTTIYEDKPSANEAHPTMKPIGLFKKLIRNSSREGELVLDLFGGSGTSILAAEQMGRTCYTMEYDPHYCDVIIKRWEDFTGKEAALINGGSGDS